ncbi:hypothetical protein [Novosphingobium panipatense]|uniref:hypothetical protein n=1 Tax=Novosphingobium panipatense TaxID=428991 RepID=UPI00360F9008
MRQAAATPAAAAARGGHSTHAGAADGRAAQHGDAAQGGRRHAPDREPWHLHIADGVELPVGLQRRRAELRRSGIHADSDGYKRFLTVYDQSLDRASNEIDASFRTQHTGRAAIVARETYQTQVYNFFSLPPVDSGFCKAAMEVSAELMTVDPTQFEAWSYTGLAKLEAPFKAFFDAYDQYRADLAAWQSRYGSNGLIIVRPTSGQASAGPVPTPVATQTLPQPQPLSQAQTVTQAPAQPQAVQPTITLPTVQ